MPYIDIFAIPSIYNHYFTITISDQSVREMNLTQSIIVVPVGTAWYCRHHVNILLYLAFRP